MRNTFREIYYWNFRMGYSYYYLDQEGRALPYFDKALEARPDDEDTKRAHRLVRRRAFLGHAVLGCASGSGRNLHGRTLLEQEAQLRRMMDEDKDHTRGQELVDRVEGILNQAFDEISFEMGVGGEKYELILTPEGDKVKLFELVYFQKHAPKEVLEHWNILVGRQPIRNIGSAHRRWLGHLRGGCADLAGGAGRKQFRHLRLLRKAAAHAPRKKKAGSGGCSPPSPTRCWARSPT